MGSPEGVDPLTIFLENSEGTTLWYSSRMKDYSLCMNKNLKYLLEKLYSVTFSNNKF